MYDKEKIYDEKIAPLMTEIIKICKENDMQMIATFTLREEEDFVCTTHLKSKEYNNAAILDAYRVIKEGYVVTKPIMLATTIKRGSRDE